MFSRFFSQPVNKVPERHDRVGQGHLRADCTHDFPNLIPHGWFVAVNRAFSAGCFSLLERTVAKTMVGIVEQGPALVAELRAGVVLKSAVAADHNLNGFSLSLHAA